MPVKSDSKDKPSNVDKEKTKKSRYSLKKLLDRSRFSPRMLRLSKSGACKTMDCIPVVSDTKSIEDTLVNQDSKSVEAITNIMNSASTSPHSNSPGVQRRLTASVPFGPYPSDPSVLSNFDPRIPICEDQRASLDSEFVEEEYEDSLTHFSDLILDNVKRAPTSKFTPKSPDTTTSSRSDAFPNLIQQQKQQLPDMQQFVEIVPANRDTDETTPPPPSIRADCLPNLLNNLNQTGIYNEPCDAKSEVDDPSTIYTLNSAIIQDASTCKQGILDKSKAALNKRHLHTHTSPALVSTYGDAGNHLTKSNQPSHSSSTSSAPSPTSSSSSSSAIMDNYDQTRPNHNLSEPIMDTLHDSNSSNDNNHHHHIHSLGQTKQVNKPHLNFPNSPRGNTVITHHPASPFARVPRNPLDKLDIQDFNILNQPRYPTTNLSSSSPIPCEGRQPTCQPMITTSTITSTATTTVAVDSQSGYIQLNQQTETTPLDCKLKETAALTSCSALPLPNSSPLSTSAPSQAPLLSKSSTGYNETMHTVTMMNKQCGTALTPSAGPHRIRPPGADSYPTYEEAWDVKMVRQHGIGICKPLGLLCNNSNSSRNNNRTAQSIEEQEPKDATSHPHMHQRFQQPQEPIDQSNNPYILPKYNMQSQQLLNLNTAMDGCSPTTSSIVHSTPVITKSTHSSTNMNQYKITPAIPQTVNTNSGNTPITNVFNGAMTEVNLPIDQSKPVCIHPNNTSINGTYSHVNKFTTPTNIIGNNTPHRNVIGPPGSSQQRPQSPELSSLHNPNGRLLKLTTTRPCLQNTSTDFDSVSTDSYDESWDIRHGRLISELARGRFVDPSSVFPTPCNAPNARPGLPTEVNVSTASHSSPFAFSTSPTNVCASPPQCSLPGVVADSIHTGTTTTKGLPVHLETLPLEDQPWFHPGLTRSDAEELIRNEPEGSFLVRPSETCPNDFSLTIKHKTFLHMKISRNNLGQFILGEYSQPYSTVTQMIYHYARTLVPVRGADSVCLTHPVSRQL